VVRGVGGWVWWAWGGVGGEGEEKGGKNTEFWAELTKDHFPTAQTYGATYHLNIMFT
jgi:hypothetical protein